MALSDKQLDDLGREAIRHAAAGDFAAAEPLLARVADARPNSGQALHLLGQVRLKLRRFGEAREPLERAAKFLPKEASAHVNLAGCLTVLGHHDASLAALDRAARLKPGDAAIAYNRGRALEALGRLEEAGHAYDEALGIDHRLLPALSARAALLEARGDWAGALGDLDMALTSRPDDAGLRLRRAELLLEHGDWLRGLPDYEARLEAPGERYAPELTRWRGESLAGRLLIYPEQSDVESDDALRDTLMLARGLDTTDAVVQCAPKLADCLDLPTIGRGGSLEPVAAAAPLRSLPGLLGWTLDALPPAGALRLRTSGGSSIGWFASSQPPPADIDVERDPARVAHCRRVVGDDNWPAHLAARLEIPTLVLLPSGADWLWGLRSGASPWYPSLEVLRSEEPEALAARLRDFVSLA